MQKKDAKKKNDSEIKQNETQKHKRERERERLRIVARSIKARDRERCV